MTVNLTLETTIPQFTVPHLVGNALAPGRHRFGLVVVDEAGNASAPAVRQVNVVDPAPTAVLDAPAQVIVTQPWQLSGARSFDAGGRIVRFTWTRTEDPAGSRMTPSYPVVTDDAGNQSQPALREVSIVPDPPPTAVLDAPRELAYGSPLELEGRRSFDTAPGRVVRYTWTRVSGKGGDMPVGQPVVTGTATYTVPQSHSNQLVAGTHGFSLVVTDDAGNQAKPAAIQVTALAPK